MQELKNPTLKLVKINIIINHAKQTHKKIDYFNV